MLTADPYALRRLADQCLAASAHMQSRSNRMLATVQSTVEGPSGWRGAGAQNYEKRGELLVHEIRKASTTLSEMTPALQALAYRVEQIQYKKHELQRVESHLSSLHMSMNLKDDAEIAYLEGRAAVLRMEIDSESAYADMSAAAAFRAIEISAVLTTELEALCKATSAVGKEIEHVAEVAWDDYIKPTAKAVWNGIEEFLDIPEMEAAWKDLMDPSKSWQDRLLAAGTLVVDGALDVSTLFGVGDAIKGAKFLVKFGWKYGKKIIEVEGRKQMAAVIKKHLNQFAENVRNGVEKLFGRGMPLRDRLGFAAGKDGKVVRFSKGAGTHIDDLLQKSTCNDDELVCYLKKVDEYNGTNNADVFASSGKWPDEIQIPKGSNVLNADGSIKWSEVPNGGYVLDENGDAIKEVFVPKEGDVIDRYGPPNGRYTSPVTDGKPYNYEQRSLPYVEDVTKYHQYKIIGDFNDIESYVQQCPNANMRMKVEAYMKKYKLSYDNLKVQKGFIAEGFGSPGGGIQYELPLPVNMLEGLMLLGKVK